MISSFDKPLQRENVNEYKIADGVVTVGASEYELRHSHIHGLIPATAQVMITPSF
ncbi:hypothetical protein NX722_13385 [Endozoicomonas gorgoniicola]|uniref:Uncharacterized protein n=1 Tax=Endozoicomonas gorgoniicola TaxID=1234144 RepID=A0ABT3MW38_9GAMM|nr:hypothetical protein [Endozoicomonas gorgoniicola]MCW7553601.1 hypothetical protein [Endozoicomonas gorgoniicola]